MTLVHIYGHDIPSKHMFWMQEHPRLFKGGGGGGGGGIIVIKTF